MEYLILGCGAIYLAKRKKLISNFGLKKFTGKFRFLDNFVQSQNNILNMPDRELEKLKKIKNSELYLDEETINKIKNHSTRVVSFNSYADINKIKLETDADLHGGDTIANELVTVEGFFEMKNKKMIDCENMFARISFSNFPKKIFPDVNRIRICSKTNGHIIKFELSTFNFAESQSHQAHIVDRSDKFEIYELPIKNLMTNPQSRAPKNYLDESVLLHVITLDIESKKEGPFKIELKYVDFEYDFDSTKFYKKYSLPIFLKV